MNIAIYTLRSIAYALTEPAFVVILIFLAAMFYIQNKKITVMQRMIIGEKLDSPLELTVSQIVIGIFAGIIGSLILSYLGVIFDENSAIDLIFLVSIVLMVWSPKFICFAYSGAVLGFVSLLLSEIGKTFNGTVNLLGYQVKLGRIDFLNIDIVSLMMLVAVLHFIEGILIIIDGTRGTIPVFTKKEDKIIGGFALKRYWPLPIALFLMLNSASLLSAGVQEPMPGWWPIVRGSIPLNILKSAVVALIPFYGVIGYNAVTFTKTRKEKTLFSGTLIMGYSVALFAVAQLGRMGFFFKLIVLIFAPLGHEIMLKVQQNMEVKGEPKFVSTEEGIMVLEVAPNSPAFEMGIKSGDLVVAVNNMPIEKEEDIINSLTENINFIWIKLKRVSGKLEEVQYNKMNRVKKIGIVFVPRSVQAESLVVNLEELKFKEVLNKIKDKTKDE